MKRKLVVLASLILLFAAGYLVDSVIAGAYTLEVTELTPQPSFADGKTPVTIRVRLTKAGAPVEGHILYILSKRGGGFRSPRVLTDENGAAEFYYYPFLASAYLEAGDVPIEIRDESNSVLISVPVTHTFSLKLEAPEGTGGSHLTNDSIFGE